MTVAPAYFGKCETCGSESFTQLTKPFIDPDVKQTESELGQMYTTIFVCSGGHQVRVLSYAESIGDQ